VISAVLTALVIGATVGILGWLILPGRQNVSPALTVLVGVVAALIGTAIARAFGRSPGGGPDPIELIIQVALAVVGVALVAGKRPRVP
jgi:uncharacterized membrane protein YeaQ/YmgE (transglycosylase-associated protein family)